MIIFQGDMLERNKKYIIHKNRYGVFSIILIFTILLTIPIVYISIHKDWIFSLCEIPLIMMIIFSLIPYKNDNSLLIPTKIIIYDGLIICEGENFSSTRKISQINKIIDRKDCYQFVFGFPHKDIRYLCQKDLLTEGTIEEFENLFKDKIIKK